MQLGFILIVLPLLLTVDAAENSINTKDQQNITNSANLTANSDAVSNWTKPTAKQTAKPTTATTKAKTTEKQTASSEAVPTAKSTANLDAVSNSTKSTARQTAKPTETPTMKPTTTSIANLEVVSTENLEYVSTANPEEVSTPMENADNSDNDGEATEMATTKTPKPAQHESSEQNESEEKQWPFYLVQHEKEKLLRCMALNAQIHYLRRAVKRQGRDKSEQVANTKPAINEVAEHLDTLTHMFYTTGCNNMNLAVSVFSKLFKLPHWKPLLKPHLLKPYGDNVAYPQVVPNLGSQVENVPENVENHKGRTTEISSE
jgi:hypothetical protein